MKNKVCLITGATSGIGEVTALELARRGATVVGVGRNPQRCAASALRIEEQGGGKVDFLLADFSSLQQVRKMAEQFLQQYDRLDVLINNAGVFMLSRKETVDGFEVTFAVNHLAHFLLTDLLLPRLRASAPSRIINVSSDAHVGGKIFLDDMDLKHGFSGWKAYAQSKLANVLFTYELARRLEGSGVTANALHPGFVATRFAHNNGLLVNLSMRLIQRFGGKTVEQGAETPVYLASAPELERVSGKYFVEKQERRSAPVSYDLETAKRLWEISEQLVMG
jgi:NAD(P)-dependent dehydrogenase (short-subunit alcohol dehydrogenase family)